MDIFNWYSFVLRLAVSSVWHSYSVDFFKIFLTERYRNRHAAVADLKLKPDHLNGERQFAKLPCKLVFQVAYGSRITWK